MKHGSLFSGGGGFDLAAESMGWQNIFHCERDEFCQRTLKYYWPSAATYSDIKEFDGKQYKGEIDIITGGFPCQPFSVAGKRRGTEDDRYLWPEMCRIIKEVEAPWAVCENVYGLINWNEGLVFQQVLSDLEVEGYQVWPFVLPAAGVDAPHQRYRVWIIAYHSGYALKRLQKANSNPNGYGRNRKYSKNEKHTNKGRKHAQHDFEQTGNDAAHADGIRLQRGEKRRKFGKSKSKAPNWLADFYKQRAWDGWPTQSPLCGGNDGLPARLDGITVPKWRQQSIKMYGNAIVPQMAVKIFEAIEAYETQLIAGN